MAEIQWGNIQNPGIVGLSRQGYAFGAQIKQQRQAEQDQNMLRGLAPQIIAGDAGAYDQAAAINPEAANAYQGAGDSQLRRLKGFINYVDQARKSDNPAAVNAALQAGSGFIGRFIGKPGPTAWTPDMEPGWEQLKAKVAMMDSAGTQGRVQSTYVDGDGNRVAIMADGTQKVLGANDAGMSQQTISIPGPDGRPRQYTFDKRTGNYVPAGEGGQPPPAPAPEATGHAAGLPAVPGGNVQDIQASFRDIGARNGFEITSMERPVLAGVGAGARSQHPAGTAVDYRVIGKSPQQIEALKADLRNAGYQVIDESDGRTGTGPHIHAELPPRGSERSPFVGRSPEEQAALTEQAKTDVQLNNLPRELQLRTDAAVQQAGGTEEAKQSAQSRVELQQLLPKVQQESQRTITLIDKALNHPGRAAATGASSKYDPRNFLPGTDATDFRVLLNQLKGGTFLQAFQSLKGGGAITETEGRKAEEAIARLEQAQSDEAFIEALGELRQVAENLPMSIQQKLGAVSGRQQAQGGSNVSRPTSEGEYNALPSGAMFIDPDDGKTYRKP